MRLDAGFAVILAFGIGACDRREPAPVRGDWQGVDESSPEYREVEGFAR